MLYGDGHVEMQLTPFCGVDQDNIYAFGPPMLPGGRYPPPSAGISGPPLHPNDSVLLPVATTDPGRGGPSQLTLLIDSGALGRWLRNGAWVVVLGWVFVRWLAPLFILSFRAAREQTPARRRIRKGLCPACGYDLRASPEQCPECGRLHT